MEKKEFTAYTDQELLEEAKKMKSFSTTNALFIGFLVGIVIYSIAMNSWGMLTLIPLYFIYKLINDPKSKRNKELENVLKERKLRN